MLKDAEFSWLKQVQDVQETENAILLADHDKTSGLLGFWKTVRMEPNMANYKCFIICDDDAPPFNVANSFYRAQLKLGLPLNILQNGKWGTYRFLALKPKRNETYSSVCIQASRPGDSQSLKWVPSINVVSEGATIEVQYIGLSRRDVMLATGRLSHESCVEQKVKQIGILGTEFAGIDANGQQVNGMRFDDEALATQISTSSDDFVFTIPTTITLEEAASIPCAYLTIYSAFFIGNRIRAGQTILIYDGNALIEFIRYMLF